LHPEDGVPVPITNGVVDELSDPRMNRTGFPITSGKRTVRGCIRSAAMGARLKDKGRQKIARVTPAFLTVKKFDLAVRKQASRGRIP
jgi:hypothetical protein